MKTLSRREKEQAILAPKDSYPERMPCLSCGYFWMQHKGNLCPAQPGGLLPVEVEKNRWELVPIMPVWGDTLFIPDVAYFTNPDFDVQ